MISLGVSLLNDFKSSGPESNRDIDLTSSEGIATILNQGENLINFVSDALDCFELDRFVPLRSEYDLEAESLRLRGENSTTPFLAGEGEFELVKGGRSIAAIRPLGVAT